MFWLALPKYVLGAASAPLCACLQVLAVPEGAGPKGLSAQLTSDSVVERLNAMRAISVVSGNPAGRTAFRGLGVEGRLADAVDSLSGGLEYDVAVKTLAVVRWRP